MSVDLQIVFPQEEVRLNSIKLVPGPPFMLDIVGQDFRDVEEVLINGVESPNYVVLSRTRLLAQVPEVIENDRLVDVKVLSRTLRLTQRSLLRFSLTRTPQMVTGILKLMQLFLLVLLNTKGSDKLEKGKGAGALRAVGRTFGAEQGGDVVGGFIVAVDTAARQIVGMQASAPHLPLDERLLSATVLGAAFNKQAGALVVSVEITSMAGRAAVANLEV